MNANTISGGTIFDSSLSDYMDMKLSPSEYKENLVELFQSINRIRFAESPGKQKIHTFVDRIAGACPYCGDSMKSTYKKRGNIILQGEFAGHYKCHNCGIYKSIPDFLRDFKINPNLDLINYLQSIQTEGKLATRKNYDISLLMDSSKIEEFAIDREILKNRFGFVEIRESPKTLNWLRSRLQFSQEKFLYHLKDEYLVVLNLTKEKNIIGFQRRNFKSWQDKYMTFSISKIYSILGIDKEIPPELNSYSQIFGLFQTDFSKRVVIFEGPLDSFLFKNSIANTGAGKHFPIEIPLYYFYDDDKKGRQKAIEHLNLGENVFLWDRFKKDYDLPNRDKWDLNDVLIYLNRGEGENSYPPFFNYFSKDPLDIIDI